MSISTQFDIIIIGGGLAGCMAAIGLKTNRQRVAIVDPQPLAPRAIAGTDIRTTALSLGSINLFRQLGLWKALKPYGTPITTIRIRDGDKGPWLTYESKMIGPDPMGVIVDNYRLYEAMQPALSDVAWYLDRPTAMTLADHGLANVTLSSGDLLTAPLVLVADGRYSMWREQLSFSSVKHDYHHTAVVGVLQSTQLHVGTAYEIFLPSGPLALLPYGKNQFAFVWSMPHDAATSLRNLTADDFNALMNDTWQRIIHQHDDDQHHFTLVGQRQIYPLNLAVARQFTQQPFWLLGDAAHAMHPVAGQGLNVGLRDVQCVLNLLQRPASHYTPSDWQQLAERYERDRRTDTFKMISVTDGLVRLFGLSQRPVPQIRRLGLGMVELISPLKKVLMKQAMGVK